jgi:hypothetical protein
MIPNLHLEELIARDRMNEARARAAQRNLVSTTRAASPLRVTLSLTLIRMGQWLAGRQASQPARARVAA